MPLTKQIHDLIDLAIREDIRSGDIITQACICENAVASAKIILKQAGIVAALPFIEVLFKKIDPNIEVELHVEEGSFQKAGTFLATIKGPMRGILTGDRITLNLLQHASGIATITGAYVKKIVGLDCAIMDTRKTLPGLRALEKYAVKVGGGYNHRFGLDDCLIFKTNHLSYLSKSKKSSLAEAIAKVKKLHPKLSIEVEVDDSATLQEALDTEANAIMLVNLSPEEAKKCVEKIRKSSKKAYIESGSAITLDTVRAFAQTGVDGVSIGDLTHSVKALDMRMRLS